MSREALHLDGDIVAAVGPKDMNQHAKAVVDQATGAPTEGINLTAIIRLKEKIAISKEFTPKERDFVLDAINVALGEERLRMVRISNEAHAAGRTKAGNDIGGL